MNGKYLTNDDIGNVRIHGSKIIIHGERAEAILTKMGFEFGGSIGIYEKGEPVDDGMRIDQRYQKLKEILG